MTKKMITVVLFAIVAISVNATVLTFTGWSGDNSAVSSLSDNAGNSLGSRMISSDSVTYTGSGTHNITAERGNGWTPYISLDWGDTVYPRFDTYRSWDSRGDVVQIESTLNSDLDLTFTPDTDYGVLINSFDLDEWAGGGAITCNWSIVQGGVTLTNGTVSLSNSGERKTVTTGLTAEDVTLNEPVILRFRQIAGDTTYLAMDNLNFDMVRGEGTTTLTFGGMGVNVDVPSDWGSYVSAAETGISVTNGGTPDIMLQWSAENAHDGWQFYNDSEWSAAQMDGFSGTATFDIQFTPDYGSAVLVESFVFDDYTNYAGGSGFSWALYRADRGGVIVSGSGLTTTDGENKEVVTGMITPYAGPVLLRITPGAGVNGADEALDTIIFSRHSATGQPSAVLNFNGNVMDTLSLQNGGFDDASGNLADNWNDNGGSIRGGVDGGYGWNTSYFAGGAYPTDNTFASTVEGPVRQDLSGAGSTLAAGMRYVLEGDLFSAGKYSSSRDASIIWSLGLTKDASVVAVDRWYSDEFSGAGVSSHRLTSVDASSDGLTHAVVEYTSASAGGTIGVRLGDTNMTVGAITGDDYYGMMDNLVLRSVKSDWGSDAATDETGISVTNGGTAHVQVSWSASEGAWIFRDDVAVMGDFQEGDTFDIVFTPDYGYSVALVSFSIKDLSGQGGNQLSWALHRDSATGTVVASGNGIVTTDGATNNILTHLKSPYDKPLVLRITAEADPGGGNNGVDIALDDIMLIEKYYLAGSVFRFK